MKTISLTRGKVAVIDDDDYERVSALEWHAVPSRHTWYAKRSFRDAETRKQHPESLHRFILGLQISDRRRVDHANRDGLDCRRSNLRISSHVENARNSGPRINNTTGFKGVSAIRYPSGFISYRGIVWVSGKAITTETCQSAESAAKAYDMLAKHFYGEFAYLNFPSEVK